MSIKTKNVAAAVVDYTFYKAIGQRVTFIGPNHSDSSKDVCLVLQRDPVPQKGEQGYRRTDVEFQATTSITEGTAVVKKLGRVAISSSLPVGMPEAEINELFARACEVAKQGTQQKDMFVLGRRPV